MPLVKEYRDMLSLLWKVYPCAFYLFDSGVSRLVGILERKQDADCTFPDKPICHLYNANTKFVV
jgi:hypothetical protein